MKLSQNSLPEGEIIMDNEENVVRLAKPQKKGLLSLVFSRFFVIVLLLVVQVVLVVGVYLYLTDALPFLLAILWLLAARRPSPPRHLLRLPLRHLLRHLPRLPLRQSPSTRAQRSC